MGYLPHVSKRHAVFLVREGKPKLVGYAYVMSFGETKEGKENSDEWFYLDRFPGVRTNYENLQHVHASFHNIKRLTDAFAANRERNEILSHGYVCPNYWALVEMYDREQDAHERAAQRAAGSTDEMSNVALVAG